MSNRGPHRRLIWGLAMTKTTQTERLRAYHHVWWWITGTVCPADSLIRHCAG